MAEPGQATADAAGAARSAIAEDPGVRGLGLHRPPQRRPMDAGFQGLVPRRRA